MLNRSKYTGDGHAWNTMPDMEVESLRRRRGGGSYFWKGGSRKGGFGRTPRTPLVTGLPLEVTETGSAFQTVAAACTNVQSPAAVRDLF